MKYKNIIFDVDGTLINTTKANMLSLQEVLLLEGKSDYTLDVLLQYDGLPGRDVLEILGVSEVQAAHRKWIELTSHKKYMFEIYFGVHALLKTLKTAGVNLSIVTSRNREEVKSDPNLTELTHFFDIIVTSDCTPQHKPHPAPLLYALEKNQYLDSETLYVGDSIYDFQSACEAEIDFAKAVWGLKVFDVRDRDYLIKEPLALLEIL